VTAASPGWTWASALAGGAVGALGALAALGYGSARSLPNPSPPRTKRPLGAVTFKTTVFDEDDPTYQQLETVVYVDGVTAGSASNVVGPSLPTKEWGKISGSFQLYLDEHPIHGTIAVLDLLFIRRHSRGRGLGRLLLEETLRVYRERGVSAALLLPVPPGEVLSDKDVEYDRLVRIYRKAGFKGPFWADDGCTWGNVMVWKPRAAGTPAKRRAAR
jgi:GNAT superfamily N-acetyltransferase